MAEETTTATAKEPVEKGKALKTLLKVLLGIVLLAVGLVFVWVWRQDLLCLIRGGIGLFLILAGVITLAIAKE